MGLVMFFQFARFLPMCELVIFSHELKLLMMRTVFLLAKFVKFRPDKYDFHRDGGLFMEKMAQIRHILKKRISSRYI
jgi:hypothetical protein